MPRGKIDHLIELDPFSEVYDRDPITTINAIRIQSLPARAKRGLKVLTYDACNEAYNNRAFVAAKSKLDCMMRLDLPSRNQDYL